MLSVVVKNTVAEALAVVRVVLGREDEGDLPTFEAGAHIDIKLPSGLVRQYSLCRLQSDSRYYEIAVLKDPQSRGGSEEVHALQIGDVVEISEPKNHFPLVNPNKKALLIAGGIGVTPLLTMAQTLQALETTFEFHYCAKSPKTAAFSHALANGSFADKMAFHYSQDPLSGRMTVSTVLSSNQLDRDLYVCGPADFITHILSEARALGWPEDALYREFFTAPVVDSTGSDDKAFRVKVASSGDEFYVAENKTIAEVLDEHGVFLAVSCESGVCGTCMTNVLEGEPDHRDVFLTDQEHTEGKLIMPCCSRAKSASITLDL
jgi:vanillate monooxygenase ferredoxin subunit